MKERPMLMSEPMVLALLNGSKTETRRIIKEQPSPDTEFVEYHNGHWQAKRRSQEIKGLKLLCGEWRDRYGQPGDRLWVKETFFPVGAHRNERRFAAVNCEYVYRADYGYRAKRQDSIIGPHYWKPSIFCTRHASRITLEIKATRVERLHDITEEGAMAEGIIKQTFGIGPPYDMFALRPGTHCDWEFTAKEVYKNLWESINGAGSWEKNPWVTVIQFSKL